MIGRSTKDIQRNYKMIHKEIKKLLSGNKKRIKASNILCIGDIILDHYIYGKVERFSPEAPVPILSIKKESYQLGGVGNVARNISSIGAKSTLFYISGDDSSPKIINKLISNEKNIRRIETKVPSYSIPIKTRCINETKQIVRLDKESTNFKLNSKIRIIILKKLINEIKKHDLIILSDYNKGLLDKKFIQKIVKIAKSNNKIIIADPKKKDLSCYSNIDIITPNQKEITESSKKSSLNEKQIISYAKNISKKYNIDNILITRSENGMLLVSKNISKKFYANAKKVYDVTGAGDTVVALLSLMIASGYDISDSIKISNYAAGLVVGKYGTATISFNDLIKLT